MGAVSALLVVGCVHMSVAAAETPIERGRALMNGIVACGNCHTP